ncbi:unnamed protein product [Macrosiphum euphorbiae]|uniref:Uncharacterized protein n=1 Tax=Macrosiphum euphorbiae TaxID=13131 RepID=A0AAV0WC54_9HEMI|nr:unnamed protein product [Macrosiphum euphorbiae]
MRDLRLVAYRLVSWLPAYKVSLDFSYGTLKSSSVSLVTIRPSPFPYLLDFPSRCKRLFAQSRIFRCPIVSSYTQPQCMHPGHLAALQSGQYR